MSADALAVKAAALAAVEAAADQAEAADHSLVTAVERAAEAGVPIAGIAAAARVSRPTVYRWLRGNPDRLPPRALWVKAMQQGCEVILAHLGTTGHPQVEQALTLTDELALARRVDIGVKNLAELPEVGSPERNTLELAIRVARVVRHE